MTVPRKKKCIVQVQHRDEGLVDHGGWKLPDAQYFAAAKGAGGAWLLVHVPTGWELGTGSTIAEVLDYAAHAEAWPFDWSTTEQWPLIEAVEKAAVDYWKRRKQLEVAA